MIRIIIKYNNNTTHPLVFSINPGFFLFICHFAIEPHLSKRTKIEV